LPRKEIPISEVVDADSFARSMEALSKTDPEKALQGISSRLADQNPWDVFPRRDFIVHILGEFYQRAFSKESEIQPSCVRTTNRLVNLLVNDPDPTPDDRHHQDVVEGKETISISTVRGHLAFTVRCLCCSREFLSFGWEITQKLLTDPNAYVVRQALYSFEELLRRRHWNEEICRVAIAELWRFFEQSDLPRAHVSQVVRCFHAVRDLNEDDAERVLRRFVGETSIEYLYAFYAVFRADHLDEMGPFDTARFERLLINSVCEDKGGLATRFLQAVDETLRETPDSFDRLYRFIREYRGKVHAQADIISTGLRLLDRVGLSTPSRFRKVLTLFRQFVRLQRRYVGASPKNAESFQCPKFLDTVFEHDRRAFYGIARDISQMIGMGASPWYMTDRFESLLAQETDPKYATTICEIYDTMIEGCPWHYKQRKDWILKATETWPSRFESEWQMN